MPPSKERNASHAARRASDNRAHPLRKPASSDDFFTDSLLDSSRIPTPSPSKKNTNNALASRPRRAIGNTRTLRDAWDATASSGRRSSAGSDLYSRPEIFRSTPAQTTGRSPAGPSKAQPTSSPPRGRHASVPTASPTSDASSPPRGLNDVYQRIADEERLAAQEGEIEEDDFTDSTMSHNDYVDEDRARLNRIRSSQSPLTFRSSSRNTPQPQAADADKENQREETGLTDASGMSFLENMTDQVLAAKLTPHTQDRARDRTRLDKAVQKTTPLAFSKAQVGSRHALTAENLQKSAARDNSASVHGSSNGSMRNEDTNPPPNVPRTWGTKGRVDKDWLRKIHDRNGSPANVTPIGDKQQSSQVDWTAAAADVPLPSVEESLTPRPEQPKDSMPTSLSKQSSLDRIRHWELNDFTGTNLLVSDSPPVKVRSSVPDQIKDREIETLEKRAVTTNRLGEIRKKNSRELLVGKARSQNLEAQKGVEDDASPEKEAMTRFEEVGEPIPDTPIVVFKASANGIKQNHNANGRPIQDRKDSRDSLQRLARAISESPKPSLTPEDWSFIKKEEAESAQPEIRKLQKMQDESRKSSREVADATSPSSVKRSISADAARTPIVTGAWTDTILPNTIKTVKHKQAPVKYAQTPHVTGGWIDTPVVTGKRQSSSIIPVPTDKVPERPDADLEKDHSKPTNNKNADTKPPTKLAPNLPRSALTSLLTKAKRKLASADQQDSATNQEEEINNNDTLNLGDATIESLEDLLTLDNADMTTLLRMGAEFEARREIDSNTSHPSGDRAADRDTDAGSEKAAGTETELLERLGTKLERLRTNIHDARKGISKLEHQVSQPSPQTSTGNTGNTVIISANGELITGPCQSCGCPRGTSSIFTTLNTTSTSNLFLPVRLHIPQSIPLPIPRLWHSPQKHEPWWRPPRPTALGYATLALWLWYLTETVLCNWGGYCHPEYAEYYVWPDPPRGGYDGYEYGINGRGEMRWGWITWTLVRSWIFGGLAARWMGSLWWLIRGSLWLMVRWVSMLAGWSDGFASEAVGAASRGSRSDGPVVGMGEDEFL
ncbi:hypothetical protein EPUS_00119 [Endocarpon pusillum Z07020]|uniref:Uncharacterized protein n=1 Tax=Endocarpon pusillum (strain Z07020 / HMAS-L-300199) TaxID=1263415 RepID=U1GCL5_ENDPU|nr:uncharacterized protein EPUS_00119 [Endocarpon pusillum Z07020]ERF75327.1 hypothetical protein EPUS_00119 [Endocarpon pusillum Z07020]